MISSLQSAKRSMIMRWALMPIGLAALVACDSGPVPALPVPTPTSGAIATSTPNPTAVSLDTPTLILSDHSGPVYSVAYSPDGQTLASGSLDTRLLDSTVKLWSLSDGKEIRTFTGHTREVKSVAFSPDGMTLASASGDNTVKLWKVK